MELASDNNYAIAPGESKDISTKRIVMGTLLQKDQAESTMDDVAVLGRSGELILHLYYSSRLCYWPGSVCFFII